MPTRARQDAPVSGPEPVEEAPRAAPPVEVVLLKSDVFGRVERLELADGRRVVRRDVRGCRFPFSVVARLLLARERRALRALRGLDGVPGLEPDGAGEDPARVVRRSFIEGVPLWAAERLPSDWFEHARALVEAVHARGVRHNDLHKEQNLLVRPDGRPAVLDLQLASVHGRDSRRARVRAAEDLRHVDKHARRYERRGRPSTPAERRARPRRSPLAAAWRRFGKPLYNGLVRLFPKLSEPEPRRASSGPWPDWVEPLSNGSSGGAPPKEDPPEEDPPVDGSPGQESPIEDSTVDRPAEDDSP